MLTDQQVDILFHEHGIATLDARRKVARAIESATRARVIDQLIAIAPRDIKGWLDQVGRPSLSTVPGEKL